MLRLLKALTQYNMTDNVYSTETAQTAGGSGSPLDVDPTAEDTKIPLPPTRNAAQRDRIQNLFAKYGIEVDPEEIATATAQQYPERIHKPVRMRVHRMCHRCKTTFGPDKTCANCQHRRCTKCPRYPAKKVKNQTVTPGTAAAPRKDSQDPPAPAGTRRTRKDDTNIHKPIRQAVSRFCHRCDTQFDLPNRSTCQNCGHNRCTRCLQEPPNSKRWPGVYAADAPVGDDDQPIPPDRIHRKPKARVRWFCDKCTAGFLEKSKTCEKCGHERCEFCTRVPYVIFQLAFSTFPSANIILRPKKTRENVDPDILKAVEAKLAQFSMSSLTPPTAVAVTVA